MLDWVRIGRVKRCDRELREQVDGADAPTLAALFNHMGREMGMMRNDRLGKAEFRNLRQRPEETLREFGGRVRNIGKIAYSEKDPNTRDELFREKFLEGFSDVQLEVQLLKENPQTFGDLANRAVDLEVIARITRGRSRNNKSGLTSLGDSRNPVVTFVPFRTNRGKRVYISQKNGPDDADDDGFY